MVIFCAILVKLSNNERSYDPALLKPNAPTEVAVVMVGDCLGGAVSKSDIIRTS